jgi:endo-1,4-beta-D-glucanase Y
MVRAMRIDRAAAATVSLVSVLIGVYGCGSNGDGTAATSTGGTSASGGSQNGGGSAQAGAATASMGGRSGTGGAMAGGATASGGTASQNATGGTGPAAGGSGNPASGGSNSTGGAAGGTGPAQGGASAGGASIGGSSSGGSPSDAGAPGLGSCVLPAGANFADVQSVYQKWKTDLLTSDGAGGFLRVRRPNSGTQINSSNSEGIGYGLEIAVFMNDQETFDKLWQYEQLHLGSNGLMDWEISPTGEVLGSGAATDGDEDMAFALVMADKKWGGQGSLKDTYLNYAKKQIDLIWQFEVDHGRNQVPTAGDQFNGGAVINISYFAPAYYRIFGEVTGKTSDWNQAAKTSYDVIEATLNAANKNATNGLIPAWSTPEGVPMAPSGTSYPTYHQLDSCRTPFRIAQDYCWFGEPRALTYLKKISAFYAQIGAANILDAYNLDGTPYSSASLHLAAFVGGAGVGAMATPENAALRNDAYTALAGWQTLIGGSEYYNKSWTVLSLLMMTGHFVDLTAH